MLVPEIDRLWKATMADFGAGEVGAAVERVEAFERSYGETAETSYLLGIAALALDDPILARRHLETARRGAPEWPEPVIALAEAHFRSRDLARARELLNEAATLGDLSADGHELSAILAEFEGDPARAHAAFEAAQRADPLGCPIPPELEPAEFESELTRALDSLPDRFREALDNVAIVVEPIPPMALLEAGDPPHDPEILGLYVGVPISERALDSVDLPDVIYLFKRNIERSCADRDTLSREIAITMYHEIAHAFGFDEDDVSDMGLA